MYIVFNENKIKPKYKRGRGLTGRANAPQNRLPVEAS